MTNSKYLYIIFFRDSTSSSSSLNISQPSFTSPPSSEPSVFRESQLSPSEIANYLSDELKRLRKRRQIAEPYPSVRSPPASPGSPEPMMADSTASTASDRASTSGIARRHATVTASAASVASAASTQPGPSSPQKSLNSSNNLVMSKSSKGERPVFTLKQMTMICEKLCKVNKFFFGNNAKQNFCLLYLSVLLIRKNYQTSI